VNTAPQTLTGMRDLLPGDAARFDALCRAFSEQFEAAGFGHLITPVIEDLAVFTRVGEGTDVVTKEMYAFEDRDGTMVALRPETTASVARAFLQHRPILPWKVWYLSQHFRHEKPQKGRYRQHHQLGAEAIGPTDPDLDVEMIVTLWDFYASIGLQRLRLEINTLGLPENRTEYTRRLAEFLESRRDALDPVDAAKIESHPLRVLDSKSAMTIAALDGAPVLRECVSAEAVAHFERVQDGLRSAGIAFVVNDRLVRGLDYYTHTVFEVISEAIDASQSTIGGGGRYDGLIEAMGGAATPGVGFGCGVERVLLACDAEGCFDPVPVPLDAFVLAFGGDGTDVRDVTLALRRAGFAVDRAFDGRSPKAQMKLADRSGARYGVISGDDERADNTVTVRDLRGDGAQRRIAISELTNELRNLL